MKGTDYWETCVQTHRNNTGIMPRQKGGILRKENILMNFSVSTQPYLNLVQDAQEAVWLLGLVCPKISILLTSTTTGKFFTLLDLVSKETCDIDCCVWLWLHKVCEGHSCRMHEQSTPFPCCIVFHCMNKAPKFYAFGLFPAQNSDGQN